MTANATSAHPGYMPHLDALRAFAIAAVLFEHFAGRTLNNLLPIGAGAFGVNLFFTLSGFLITGILLQEFGSREQARAIAWRNFYIRRLARLVPIFYLAILALALLDIGSFRTSWLWHVTYLSNVYIAQGGEKTVFWTLAVEEQFYLLWPLVIALVARKHLVAAAICLVLFALIWKVGTYLLGVPRVTTNVLLPGNLEPLGFGCLLAIVSYRRGRPNQFDWYSGTVRTAFSVAACMSLALAVSIAVGFGRSSLENQLLTGLLTAVFYCWLVLQGAMGFTGWIKRVFDLEFVLYVGKISYGIYVVHNFVPKILEKYVGVHSKLIDGPIVLIIVFLICHLSWRYVESPIIAWARSYRSATMGRPPEAASTDPARPSTVEVVDYGKRRPNV